jgi:hypothetical protein
MYYQKDALGELGKCKTSKFIYKPKFLEKSDISGFLTGFHKLFPDMSDPLSSPAPSHQRLSPSQTYSARKLSYRNSNRTCSTPSLESDLFGSPAEFQRGLSDMFGS